MVKIHKLFLKWPKGSIATSKWLGTNGFSRQLLRKYRQSGWIASISYGAFAKKGETVDWKGALYAIQSQLNKSVHIGGKTALELQGYGHFVRFKETKVYLFCPVDEILPNWFKNHNWGPKIVLKTTDFLRPTLGLEEEIFGEFSLKLSSPERAIFEVLHLAPQLQSLEESRYLMENLPRLRPALVQELLEACTSIKVKRLFLFFAKAVGHSWLEDLNLSKIDLGSRKRPIIRQGKLNSKY